jgi:WD40 repeat protein
MDVSPDEKWLASMGTDGGIKFWRLEGWTMIDQVREELSFGATGAIKFVGDFLVVALEKANYLYRYGETGLILESKVLKTFNPSRSNTVGYSLPSNVVVAGDRDGTLKTYGFV